MNPVPSQNEAQPPQPFHPQGKITNNSSGNQFGGQNLSQGVPKTTPILRPQPQHRSNVNYINQVQQHFTANRGLHSQPMSNLVQNVAGSSAGLSSTRFNISTQLATNRQAVMNHELNAHNEEQRREFTEITSSILSRIAALEDLAMATNNAKFSALMHEQPISYLMESEKLKLVETEIGSLKHLNHRFLEFGHKLSHDIVHHNGVVAYEVGMFISAIKERDAEIARLRLQIAAQGKAATVHQGFPDTPDSGNQNIREENLGAKPQDETENNLGSGDLSSFGFNLGSENEDQIDPDLGPYSAMIPDI